MILRNQNKPNKEPCDECRQVERYLNGAMNLFRSQLEMHGGVTPKFIEDFNEFIAFHKMHTDRCFFCNSMFNDFAAFMDSFTPVQSPKQSWFAWAKDAITTQIIGGIANHMAGKAYNKLMRR